MTGDFKASLNFLFGTFFYISLKCFKWMGMAFTLKKALKLILEKSRNTKKHKGENKNDTFHKSEKAVTNNLNHKFVV